MGCKSGESGFLQNCATLLGLNERVDFTRACHQWRDGQGGGVLCRNEASEETEVENCEIKLDKENA